MIIWSKRVERFSLSSLIGRSFSVVNFGRPEDLVDGSNHLSAHQPVQ